MNPETLTCATYLFENGIHQITLHKASREAVAEFFDLIEHAINSTPRDGILRILLNVECEMLPIQHTIGQLKPFINRQKHRPTCRVAILYEKSLLRGIIQSFVNRFTQHRTETVMLLPFGQEARALHWLAQDE